jgi:hypothetical protein
MYEESVTNQIVFYELYLLNTQNVCLTDMWLLVNGLIKMQAIYALWLMVFSSSSEFHAVQKYS